MVKQVRNVKEPFSAKDYEGRIAELKARLQQLEKEGWSLSFGYLYCEGYPDIDDWHRDNVRMAEGFALTLERG